MADKIVFVEDIETKLQPRVFVAIQELTVELNVVARELKVSKSQISDLLNRHGFNISNKTKVKLNRDHLEIIAIDYIKQLRSTIKKYYSPVKKPKKKGFSDFLRAVFFGDAETDNELTYLTSQGNLATIDFERIKEEFIEDLLHARPRKVKKNYFMRRSMKFALKIRFSFITVREIIRHIFSSHLFHVFTDEEDTKNVHAPALSYSYPPYHGVACLIQIKTSSQHGTNRILDWKNKKM